MGLDKNINFYISDCQVNISEGRPKGGLLIIWKKEINSAIVPTLFNANYIGVKIKSSGSDYLLINSYFPYEDNSPEKLTIYRETMAKLAHEIEMYQDCVINIVGDFNADPRPTRFWQEVLDFCSEFQFSVADLCMPNDSFTYLSPMHDSTSWLDHVIVSRSELVNNFQVLYYLSIYDHFPLSYNLKIDVNIIYDSIPGINPEYFVNWINYNSCKNEIDSVLNEKFPASLLNNELFCCQEFICDNPDHKRQIDQLREYLVTALLDSTEILAFRKKRAFKKVPGWNDICKHKYGEARHHFLHWKANGMCKNGIEYENMKNSRAEFREALQYCRDNETILRENRIINAYRNKDFKTFWRQVCVKRNFISSTIDGATEKDKIVNIFHSKFFEVLDDKSCQTKPSGYREKLVGLKKFSNEGCRPFRIHSDIVQQNILKLRTGIDNDNIHTNHLKMANENCILFITQLFNAMLQHCHFSKRLLCGEIRPIIKNKFGNASDSNNFRPVMISSNLLKLFEYCIQPSLSNSLLLHDNQFGFRAHTSTQMTISVVKEVIHHYNDRKSDVFASFLDLSKGFDKVNHHKLIDFIWNSSLHYNLKLMMREFLVNQTAYTGYDKHHSDVNRIGNGVRQGAINSPLLFNFYLSSMIKEISESKIGCKLEFRSFAIISYADDLVLLAPTQSSLQYLLNCVSRNLHELSLTINSSKTKVMIFRYKKRSINNCLNFYIDNAPLEIVHEIKYLGVILCLDGCNAKDIERVSKSFIIKKICVLL